MGNRAFIDYLYQNSASVDGQWNGVWGLLRVYNGRVGLQADLLALPNNTAGAAPLSTNDSAFPIDSTFPTGSTDFKDSTDSSVSSYSTATTDTSLMSGTMLGTDSTSTTTFTYAADGSVATASTTSLTPTTDASIDTSLIGGGVLPLPRR